MNKKYIKPLAKIIRLRRTQEKSCAMSDVEYRPLQPIGVTVAKVGWDNIFEKNSEE